MEKPSIYIIPIPASRRLWSILYPLMHAEPYACIQLYIFYWSIYISSVQGSKLLYMNENVINYLSSSNKKPTTPLLFTLNYSFLFKLA